jgi:diguanylate cyclase (GGDEF)-like protein/PAS domain S-box-containing protein
VVLRKALHLVLIVLCATAPGFAAGAPGTATANRAARQDDTKAAQIDFSASAAMIQLQPALSRYHAPDNDESDGSLWYIVTVANNATRPVTRVLVAGQPADAALHVFPRSGRAMIRQVASSEGGVLVEREPAFGRHAFRVTIPPGATVALALRLTNVDRPPSVLAWSEAAFVAYHRRLAIFIAVVAGLIAAAAAIASGVAAMTGRAVSRWAAATLVGIFAVWLATIGAFDAGWSTAIGGPYGFAAMLGGLTLAAAVRLVEDVAPLSDLWPWAERYQRWGVLGLVALSLFAFVGVPGATLLVDIALVFGAAGLAAYLVRRGMMGARAARVLAPAASVFALVTLAGAVAALGGFHGNPVASEIVGGFAAAGAVLLALAVAAGVADGPVVRRLTVAGFAPPQPVAPEPPPPSHPMRRESGDEPPPAAVAAIGASHQGVYDLDFRTDRLHLSAEAAALIGFTKGSQSLAHSSWVGRVHPDDRAIYKGALRDYRSHPGLAFRIEFRVRSESGRYPWFELRATMMGEGEQADRCLGLMADVTTRKEAEAAIIDRTLRDPLTGLGNRVALMEELDRLGAHPKPVAFALLDIDRFKAIHASLGDAGADAVLQHIAERLTKRFSDVAEVFRVGGDSFALLFPKGGGGASAVGAELVDLCASPLVENARKIFAPASVGVATGHDAEEPLDLLRNAELALRQAKRQGGGCARIYSEEMDGLSAGDTVALEADLRRGLEEGQIDLFYQPIMRLADRTVAGFEALLRWHHPERGLVWPADFVGHSEESGLIVALGKFALARATEDLARWQRFFPVDPPLYVSVNVSRRQLQHGGFADSLAEILDKSEIAPGSLWLEVTESAIAASEHAGETLARIRALGAGLAIDDFGTGLSSLSQLKSIPFDAVKIDKSFLARHGEGEVEEDGEVILTSIVGLARELKRSIVVEGVESEEEALHLAELGCEYAQGFHFSVPLPAREALNFIALHYDAEAHKSAEANDADEGSGASGVGG